jgi:hypothetical protein
VHFFDGINDDAIWVAAAASAQEIGGEQTDHEEGFYQGAKWLLARMIAIRSLAGEAQRWVPVTERLPENVASLRKATRYLICFNSGTCVIGKFSGGCWFDDDDSYWNWPKVAAWMPLPEPYAAISAAQGKCK